MLRKDLAKDWKNKVIDMETLSKFDIILPGIYENEFDSGVMSTGCLDKYRPM